MGMYREHAIPGKGVGCLAEVTIKKGTLILRETPALHMDSQVNSCYLERAIKAFLGMSQMDQTQYLSLANKYDCPQKDWSEYSKEFLKIRNNDMKYCDLGSLSVETATKVWQILETNSFHNGLCLHMSRFNHSCRSNAEFFWNQDTNTRDVRAIRNISRNEEITLNYRKIGTLTREERRKYLQDFYHFHCCCEACDVTEEQVKEENMNCSRFTALCEERRILEESQSTDNFCVVRSRREVDCLKEMYSLVKKLRIFRLSTVIKDILEEGFQAATQGFYNSRFISCDPQLRSQLLKDAVSFAEVGVSLSQQLYGENHPITQLWLRRKRKPVECFLEEMT